MKKVVIGGLLFLTSLFVLTGSVSADPAKLYNGKARWHHYDGARWYNVYYKKQGQKDFKYGVSRLNKYTDDFTIKHLDVGQVYWYRVSAVNNKGHEVWITDLKILPKIQ